MLPVNATGVTAGPAESNGKLLLGTWRDSLHVTCGLTACTPGSVPGPTLGNEYGKTLPNFLPLAKCSGHVHPSPPRGDATAYEQVVVTFFIHNFVQLQSYINFGD